MNTEQEPQAQSGEPTTVAVVEENAPGNGIPEIRNFLSFVSIGDQLITLQSHREAMAKAKAHAEYQRKSLSDWVQELSEAIAKKDAALDACVEALEKMRSTFLDTEGRHGILEQQATESADAAIAKAEEART